MILYGNFFRCFFISKLRLLLEFFWSFKLASQIHYGNLLGDGIYVASALDRPSN